MLLATKIAAPPLSPFIVPRPHLFRRLEQAVLRKLTLVTAPAGYGKTMLIASWLAQQNTQGKAAAWLLLDEYDADPARFMRYFLGAIQQIAPHLGAPIVEMLQANHVAPVPQSMEEMFTTLIHELTQTEMPLVLVIDDLHLITNPQIIDSLRFWIEHAPAHIHTILMSRDASKLPVARWRVRQLCTELTMSDLRFTLEEAIPFVRTMLRLDLTDAEILRLLTRTEGWIAGLQLAAMSLQNVDNPKRLLENFTGSDRYIMDYLIEEVLEKQPSELRDFLLRTAMLKRLSPALCDFVLERTDSYQMLEQLEKRNLFLAPLDNQRDWYRYHPLFAETLYKRLQVSHQALLVVLHRRAHTWLRQSGEIDAAIEHALAAQLYAEAAELLQQQSHTILWHQGRPRSFLQWCAQIPENDRFALPALLIAIGWAYLLMSKYKALTDLIQAMQARWSSTGFDFADGAQFRDELALLRAEVAIHRGDIAQVMQILAEIDSETAALHPSTQTIAQQLYGYANRLDGNIAAAKRFLQRAASLAEASDNKALWLYAHFDLAETHALAGEFTMALAIFEQILRRFPAERYPGHHSLTYIYIRLARVLYLQNRLVEATDYLQQGLLNSANTRWLARYGLLLLAELRYAQGKWSEVEALIEKVKKAQGSWESQSTQIFFATALAKLYLLHGDIGPVAGWAATCPQQLQGIPRYQQHVAQVTLARYQVAIDAQAAIVTLNDLRQIALDNHWHASLLELNILRALAYQAFGQPNAALAALDAALTLAEPEQLLTPFVIEGAPIALLLRKALEYNPRRAFIGQLQAAFLPVAVRTSDPVAQPLVEPLTKRELEVLQMLAEGRSNPEIAEHLILATGTVAKHTNNIFSKLGARNRTEAVQRAQSLGLL